MNTFKINQSQYRQFFASLNKYNPSCPGEEDYWRSKLTGGRVEESTILVNKGELTDKLWFVLSGLVARHSDFPSGNLVYKLYKKDKFVWERNSYVLSK